MQQKQGPQRAEGKETLSGKGQISVQRSAETPNTKPHLNKLLLLSLVWCKPGDADDHSVGCRGREKLWRVIVRELSLDQ